jgi:plastocyanin
MRSHVAAGMAALAVGLCVVGGCNSPVTGPDSTSAPADAIVIEILGMNGDHSFSPHSMAVPVGRAVVWHNSDFNTHRIALDGGGLDSGDIRPGRFSPPMTISDAGRYHCAIHPSMIGAFRRAE